MSSDSLAKAREAKAAKRAALSVPAADVVKDMSPEDIAAKIKELGALLATHSTPVPAGARPGSIVGEGLTAEYVPYSAKWFMENEQLHEVIPADTQEVIVNGVSFGLLAGRRCKLPTSHYMVYLDQLQRIQETNDRWAPQPGNPQFVVSRLPGVWSKTPLPE
jgi:hypothetical protein